MEILMLGLTSDTLDYRGRFHHFDNVPLEMAPWQRPHPPFWAAGNRSSAAAGHALRLSRGVPGSRRTWRAYRALWEAHQHNRPAECPLDEPFVGSTRHIVVADTDAEAEAIARSSWPAYNRNFAKRGLDGPGPETDASGVVKPLPAGGPGLGGDVDKAFELERCVAGSPDTVAAHIEQYTVQAGVNYCVVSFQWGNITHAQAMRSLELFGTEVMPRVQTRIASPITS